MKPLFIDTASIPVSEPKPLVHAIRTLIAGGFVLGVGMPQVRAELPVPVNGGVLSATPVDIAIMGKATAAINGNTLNIKQLSDKAAMDWKSFNIGSDNAVRFDQPSTTSIALNRIHDQNPSQILGSLTANGQVYLVNQNGFVFGKNSQVNVNSLVATTLGISDEVFQRGITKVFDISNSPAFEGNGQLFLKNDQGQFVLDQKGEKIKIQIFIEEGAKIKTEGNGGRVIIAAPTVTNAGTIETPDGQTILVGSKDKVYLQEAGSDSDIRGLLVEVGTGGETNNVGKVIAERGNASLMGFAVNQKGIASATTSVRLNGSVRLLAREGIQSPSSTGGKLLPGSTTRATDQGDSLGTSAKVTLSKGSVTSVDLDADKSLTAIDAQAQAASTIEISGHKVLLQDQSTVQAKSGKVSIAAVDNPADPRLKGKARILLEKGSKIDVSGVKNVSLPIERNVVQVELRKNELKDSPLQREGVLFGKKVLVDLRDADLKYSATGELTSASIPLADIKGAVDRVARNIDERSTSGGTVKLASSGDIVSNADSLIDFSGGSVAYQDGTIKTTQLQSGSQVFDIAKADPNLKYDAILDKTFNHFEDGYVEGKAGGHLAISAYEAKIDGGLNGKTIDGALQRTADQRAAGSSLLIDLNNNNLFGKQDIVIGQTKSPLDIKIDEPLPRKATGSKEPAALVIDPELLGDSGAQAIDIKTNGSLLIKEGARLNLTEQAHLNLTSVGLDVLGSIIAPSGTVNANPITLASGSIPSQITLGAKSVIDVSGRWVNDSQSVGQHKKLGSVAIDGGKVSLTSEQADLRLEKGSRISANGGGWYKLDGNIEAGSGGNINLVAATHEAGGKVASLLLGGELNGWGLGQGGQLSLSSNEVYIGSSTPPANPNSSAKPLVLKTDFFNQGGFSAYNINANFYGLKVADNAQINPRQDNLQLNADAKLAASGTNLQNFSSVVTLPDVVRKPTDLALSLTQLAGQNKQQVLSIGKGVVIKTDAQANLTLSSDTSIFVNGTLEAPAGNISLTIEPPVKGDSGFFASQSIWLGAGANLLAKGAFKPELSPYGLNTGDVLPGGNIDLTAKRGYIVTDAKSVIDASGTASVVDLYEPIAGSSQSTAVSKVIASEGGTISLKAGEGLLLDGQLKAQSGGNAAGGTLAIELSGGLRNKPEIPVSGGEFPDDQNVRKPRTIEVSATNTINVPSGLAPGGSIPSAQFNGRALVNSAQLNNSGADSLSLKLDATAGNDYTGSILFNGDVQLNAGRQIALDAPSFKTSNGQVRLNTDYAMLGASQSRLDNQLGAGIFNSRLAPTAVTGSGQLTVNAGNIDLLGGLSFNGFGTVNLNSQGDVRAVGIRGIRDTRDYLGELDLAGNLTIKASQVYPSTLTDYKFNVSGNGDQTIKIQNSGNTPGTVLSAGGKLTFNAPNIIQQGTIKVPFGALTLNAAKTLELASGSVTSVSGAGLTVPFGQVSGGMNWVYPFDTTGSINLLINTPPEKRLSISGRDIAMKPGATVDLSGGGDLYAYEFIPGPGGSKNVLDATTAGFTQKYAVVPGLHNGLTPIDPQTFASSGLNVGDSVYLSDGSGLTAGWYTLLPANYALLPGAYLVTPKSGTRDFAPGQAFKDLTGATVVAGKYGVPSAGIRDARWQGFAVESGAVARTRSEYKDYSANQFFADKAKTDGTVAPQLPKDAGGLSIAVNNSLSFGAKLLAAPVLNGLGGQVDISANRLSIVGRREDIAASPQGTVSLLDDDLNALNAPSLLLGGQRSKEKTGQRIKVATQVLNVSGNTDLKGQEILLAASDQLKISSGAVVESTAKTLAAGIDLLVDNQVANVNQANSDGALLRVSANGQANISRDKATSGQTGVLTVEDGAVLKATGSMLLDSTRNTVFDGKIDMQGGSLALKSSRISLGNAPQGTAGLVLKNTQFTLDELKLTSTSDFDIYGAVGIKTKQLQIDAGHINGFNGVGDNVEFEADLIKLTNTGATSNQIGSGTGSLTLAANSLELGSGDYTISGFRNVSLSGSDNIKGLGQRVDALTGVISFAGPGSLRVSGDLSLNAGQFIGENGATTTVDASGHQLSLTSVKPANAADNSGLGASWSVIADSISSQAVFDLPSGVLALKALNGNIDLNSGTAINVAGQVATFGSLKQASSAGTVDLTSNNGNINLAQDATINLAGGSVANKQISDAGALKVSAPTGIFDWQGTINAGSNNSSAKQGKIHLDVASLGDSGLSGLNSQLAAAGFTDAVSLRQRQGDVALAAGDKLHASSFSLIADQGKVSVDGEINVSAAEAGNVSISGRNGIVLGTKAVIDAHSSKAGAEGGAVLLNTVHADDVGSGTLYLANGGAINLVGGAGGQGGSLHLRTGSGSTNGSANISAINASFNGADSNHSQLEVVQVYDDQSVINAANIAQWKADAESFMATVLPVSNASGAGISTVPGIEVRGQNDLTLTDKWDFIDWRYKDASGNKTLPGFLTLNAGKNLNINAALSDAFATDSIPGQANRLYQDMLQPGLSWSYSLKAGGDINLANSYLAPSPSNSSSLVKTQVVVRTGTGSIALDAANNIQFVADAKNASAAAAVYTMGTTGKYTKSDLLAGLVPGVPVRQAGETEASYLNRLDPALVGDLLRFGYLDESRIGTLFQKAEFPTQGGNISLHAGANINGIATGQKISDWLVRSGTLTENNRATLWGINISGDRSSQTGDIPAAKGIRTFNQNVGALGGGNVTVDAGGDITNLSVMIPTTGKPLGTVSETPNQWLQNSALINGGGNLALTAGNNITGGEYFTGKGTASLTAGGSIANAANGLGSIFELSDSQVTVQARKDLNIGATYNPTLLKQTQVVGGESRFFTYGADSAINFSSTAGNIVFQNNVNPNFEYSVYPGAVKATAWSGDININKSMALYPSAHGQLQLLANSNIKSAATAGQTVSINVSDADPALLPNPSSAAGSLEGSIQDGLIRARERLDPFTPISNIVHALVPTHLGSDAKTMVIANKGDIGFAPGSQVTFFVPNASEFIAGRDIKNLSLSGQNLSVSDTTRILAGRDIVYNTQINADGVVFSNDNQVQLGGAGQLQIFAGRNINLGASAGVQTIGNIFNPVLDSTGASISLAAGLSDTVDIVGFIKKYETDPKYKEQLQALKQLNDEDKAKKLDVLLKVLFEEIKQSASSAAAAPEAKRSKLYQRGFDAIQALFPGKKYAGDLSFVFSQIKTLDGGDINLVAPGGKIDVGLAGQLGGIRKKTDQLGVVVQQQGNLNSYSQGDFNVNQSRVFTLGGGDITVWSSKGSIDAGKGAKSAIAAPPPVTSVDANGNIITIFPPIVSGSGIQAIGKGQVTLAAPTGIVDAGEAGISGGQIVIAATAVVGAGNISATGGSVGVPTAPSAPTVPSGASSAATNAAKSGSDMSGSNSSTASNNNSSEKPGVSVITTDVVGYGECSVEDVRNNKAGCGDSDDAVKKDN